MTKERFNRELERLQDYLYNWSMGLYNGNVNDALDLLQDVNYKALTNWYMYDENQGLLRTWLSTIMKNEFITKYRKKKARQYWYYINYVNDYIDRQESEVYARFELDEVEKIIDSMRGPMMYALRESARGRKYEEIAEITGFPLGTIKAMIHRGRKKLKVELICNE